jgi:hypothetical protein
MIAERSVPLQSPTSTTLIRNLMFGPTQAFTNNTLPSLQNRKKRKK